MEKFEAQNNEEIMDVVKYYESLDDDNNGKNRKEAFHKFLLTIMKVNYMKYKIVSLSSKRKNTDGPVIYAVNHTNIHDIPIACNAVGEHVTVLLENGVEHNDLNGFIMKLNGVIFVDRKNDESQFLAKENMIKTLETGRSVLMFPEGTWNMSENLPMYEMKWGIIEVATRAGVPIVPVTIDYNGYDVYVNIGQEIEYSKNQIVDKRVEINKLRDIMSTMRWNLWESFPILKSSTVNRNLNDEIIKKYLCEYKKLDVEYEKSVRFKTMDSPDDVFSFIEDLEPKEENAFLFRR